MAELQQNLEGVSLLGNQNTKYKYEYDPSILEKFENNHRDSDDIVSLDAFEFCSRCVVGETMIDVATNETEHPHGVPIKDLVGTEGYVFCVDPDTREPLCRKYHDVRKTGENVPVVKIMMETMHVRDGLKYIPTYSSLTCTPEHLILVKRGFKDSEWIQAKDLQPGMRLISDQRSGDTIRSKSRHRLVGEAIFDEDLQDVHHIDHNHYNNSPENLANLSVHEHQHLHRSADYGYDTLLNIEELVDLYNSGENFHTLAERFNCDVSTIESRIGNIVNRRTQGESLSIRCRKETEERDTEMCELYEKGYLLSEIADYMQCHSTTVLAALESRGIKRRESNFARYNRRSLDLPPLNHRVIKVVDAGTADVYNMEVEDVENYFANEVVIHNCPKTGQPDFATIYISYIPDQYLVESKSLKLYLFSFQQHGAFHETCVHQILQDLVSFLQPRYLEVYGDFNSRGGISILPFAAYATEEFKDFKRQRQLAVMNTTMTHRPRTS